MNVKVLTSFVFEIFAESNLETLIRDDNVYLVIKSYPILTSFDLVIDAQMNYFETIQVDKIEESENRIELIVCFNFETTRKINANTLTIKFDMPPSIGFIDLKDSIDANSYLIEYQTI